jgi:nicotinamide-nucleotide amidase
MSAIKQLQELCLLRNISVAVAESCTAGLVASNITSISGSSKYFKGGIIAYQNEIKIKILGVSEKLITEKTEVSAEVVEKMAYNTLSHFDVDFSIATSGYAGPSGGTSENPVGTVFIAVANQSNIVVKRCSFTGDRQRITNQATKQAVLLLLSEIKKIK